MYEGVTEDLVRPVGQTVDWFLWDPAYFTANYSLIVDDIYDVSSSTFVEGDATPDYGRKWRDSFQLPVAMGQLIRSSNVMNERGFYVTDTLRLVVNVGEILEYLPALLDNPSSHIRDRIVYKNQVFVPTRVLPRGIYANNYAVVTIDCNQVNPEELVNDPQFSTYVPSLLGDNRTVGYGNGYYGSEAYGE
jgi:hypothetical protein